MNKPRISNRLGQFRKQRGLTIREFAKELGVGESAYKKWEYSLAYPSIDDLMKIADFYGVTLDDLFIRDDASQPFKELSGTADDTQAIIRLLKTLGPSGKARVLGYMQGLVDSNTYELKNDLNED